MPSRGSLLLLFSLFHFAESQYTVTTFAGANQPPASGGGGGLIDGAGTNALFKFPYGLALVPAGGGGGTSGGGGLSATLTLIVADTQNNVIRGVSPAGVTSTLAGTATAGSVNGVGSNARFYYPTGVAIDAYGSVYISDSGNNMIRRIALSTSAPGNGALIATVTLLAGGATGAVGVTDGVGTNALFSLPAGISVSAQNELYVADSGNNKIR